MKFDLKGDYFNNTWNNQANKADRKIQRLCPADLDLSLWEMSIHNSHVEEVIDSAQQGFKTWKKVSLEERINLLKTFQKTVESRMNEIATAIALESGKPFWEAITEVKAIIGKVDVTISNSLPRIKDYLVENAAPGATGHVVHHPIGPCLIVGPFNFPCHLANGQMVNALISGNSVILKPSEKTAFSGQILVECYATAGFPSGVINLIQGDGEIARRLIKEKSVRGVFFTGSKEVGLNILKETYSDLPKMVALELGGKNFSILHKDADLEMAHIELLKACFLTTGQRCISTSIVPIHKDIYQEFISKFHESAKKLVIDHPIEFEQEPFMGPLVDQRALDNYLLFIGMAKREGFQEIMRGKQLEKKFKGHYVTPSIHFSEKWKSTSHFLASEVFGPNVAFIPYTEIEEAISYTNSTEYGLASSVFSASPEIYQKCLLDIECGQVNWNKSTVGASSKLPFGGVKFSGNFRPAAVAMIDSCVYQKASLTMNDNWTLESSLLPGIKI